MGLFGGGKTDLDVRIDRSDVVGGDTLGVSVTVGTPDRRVVGGAVELVYVNHYQYDSTDGDGDSTTVNARRDVVADTQPLFGQGQPQACQRTFQFTVPDAPGTSTDVRRRTGEQISWTVRARLDRSRARDHSVDAPFRLLSPERAYADRATTTPQLSGDDCGFEFRLADRTLRPGVSLRGDVTIRPREETKVAGIRAELVAMRFDPDNNSSTMILAEQELSPETTFGAGEGRSFPLALTAPIGVLAPTFVAEKNEQRVFVRVVMDRRLRGDHSGRLELNSCTAPGNR